MDEELKESINNTAKGLVEMLIEKNTKYGNAIFDLGIDAVVMHLYEKVMRLKTLNDIRDEWEVEGDIEDTLKDIAGYAILGLQM